MIFWIASYPKSGNTWLRALISAYYFTRDGFFSNDRILENIDLNKINNKPIIIWPAIPLL